MELLLSQGVWQIEEERKPLAQLVNLEEMIVEPDAIAAVSEQQINA